MPDLIIAPDLQWRNTMSDGLRKWTLRCTKSKPFSAFVEAVLRSGIRRGTRADYAEATGFNVNQVGRFFSSEIGKRLFRAFCAELPTDITTHYEGETAQKAVPCRKSTIYELR